VLLLLSFGQYSRMRKGFAGSPGGTCGFVKRSARDRPSRRPLRQHGEHPFEPSRSSLSASSASPNACSQIRDRFAKFLAGTVANLVRRHLGDVFLGVGRQRRRWIDSGLVPRGLDRRAVE
jgi:hypothetical protein